MDLILTAAEQFLNASWVRSNPVLVFSIVLMAVLTWPILVLRMMGLIGVSRHQRRRKRIPGQFKHYIRFLQPRTDRRPPQ